MRQILSALPIPVFFLGGCAGLNFGEGGLTYYEPTPYLFVSVNKDCISTATVISLPGEKRSVKFDRGYGSADLSLTLANGIITNAGQKTDVQVPETITSIADWRSAMAQTSLDGGGEPIDCIPSASMYLISGGIISDTPMNRFPVQSGRP